MMKFFRRKQKTILLILVFAISIIFVLSIGAVSLSQLFIAKSNDFIVGKIDNHPVKMSKLRKYIDIIKTNFLLEYGPSYREYFTSKDLMNLGWELLILSHKAKKIKIKTTDKEIMEYIRKKVKEKNIDINELIRRRRTPLGIFKQQIKEIINVNKLIGKYLGNIEVKDEEIRKRYRLENQKAKIAFIFVPYEKFSQNVKITDDEIKSFFEKNKEFYRLPPRVRIKYIFIKEKDATPELLKELEKSAEESKNIDTLGKEYSLTVKDSGELRRSSPLEFIGWNNELNNFIFKTPLGVIENYYVEGKGYIFFQKIQHKNSYIPSLKEISAKVKNDVVKEKALEKTDAFLKKILKESSNLSLDKIAKKYNLKLKETDFFNLNSYIEGIGINPRISSIILQMKKGEIYPSPIILPNGGYLIELRDLSALDEEKFKKEKDKYKAVLLTIKRNIKYMQLLKDLYKEFNVKFYYNPSL